MEAKQIVACLTLVLLAGYGIEAKNRDVVEHILQTLKNRSLNAADVRPDGTNQTDGPVQVNVNIFVRTIKYLRDNELSIQLTFREEWVDKRLAFNDINGAPSYVSTTDTTSFWGPDLFFANELDSQRHDLMSPNKFIRIFPDGRVLYSERLSLTLACPMRWKRFPFDVQECSIRMASYGLTMDDMELKWKAYDPVQITKVVSLREYDLSDFTTDYCNSKTNTGEYSCLFVSLHFKRHTFYFYVHFFVPFFLLVLLSWISFWLHPRARFTRGVIGILTLSGLTLAVQSGHYYSGGEFLTALGVWTTGCFIFLLSAFLEFIYVDYLFSISTFASSEADEKRDGADAETKQKMLDNQMTSIKMLYRRLPIQFQKIDFYSRFGFPLAFLLFNIVYWVAFM